MDYVLQLISHTNVSQPDNLSQIYKKKKKKWCVCGGGGGGGVGSRCVCEGGESNFFGAIQKIN